jgi:uncharacterized damage-inducible protein DinB
MADRKPPRMAGDEREILLSLLQYQRLSLVRKVIGVDEGAARRSPVASGTTLLWLVKHMARAESLWILRRFAGQNDDSSEDTGNSGDSLISAVGVYRATWREVDAVVAASDLDQVCRETDDERPVNLRWVLTHLLEETARHAGHADVLRELIDGSTGR